MRAIDICNFRRNLEQCNFIKHDTPPSIMYELIALQESINFIISSWMRINLDIIKYEKDKITQS